MLLAAQHLPHPNFIFQGTVSGTSVKTSHIPILKYPRPVVLVFQLKYVQGYKELFQLWVEDVTGDENSLFFKCGVQVNPITKQKIHL